MQLQQHFTEYFVETMLMPAVYYTHKPILENNIP